MPKVDDYALSAFQAIGQSTPKTLRERYLFRSPTLPTPVSLPSASSIAFATTSPSPGMTWLYVSSVMETLEWPSISETIFGCTLLVSSSVAQVCLRSWKCTSGTPAHGTLRFAPLITSSRASRPPLGYQPYPRLPIFIEAYHEP